MSGTLHLFISYSVCVKQLVEKCPFAIRWFHRASYVYRLLGWSKTAVFKLFPWSFCEAFHVNHKLVQGMGWYFMLMRVFFLYSYPYVGYTIFSGE